MYKRTDLKLDKDRKRVQFCPCGKSNKDGKFVPYEGHDDKGYCHSCQETFLPNVSSKTKSTFDNANRFKQYSSLVSPPSHVPFDSVISSLDRYNNNKFIIFLNQLVGTSETQTAIQNYLIGTASYAARYSTIFWQISNTNNPLQRVRTGKIIEYQIIACLKSSIGKDCKRVKTNIPPVNWVHRDSRFPDFNLRQCLFGEHLLRNSSKTIAITESEKSAVIASIYLPQFTWLAAGSLSNLRFENCKVLEGRKVVLFPDLNGYDLWAKKAQELSRICEVKISDLLDKKASYEDRQQGLDLADYLIKIDYRKFIS